MANENKEIGEIVKKCKILLLDIEGTTTSISFVKDKLFPYAAENVKQFLDSQWEKEDVKEAVTALRKLAIEDQESKMEGVVTIPGEDASKEDQIEGLVSSVKWQMSADRKAGPLKQLQGLIWKQGYDNGDIKGHVYDDVSAALEQWHSAEGQKVYIYSSGSVQAQKLLFGQSMAGDLLRFIDGHFDTTVGAKQEAASYTNIVEKIGCKPDEILFLTDIVKEAEAARTAGVHAALVSREGNAPLPTEATASFPVLHSLADLTVSNKRKQEPQDEMPAKVPKTDIENDVKASAPQPETTAVSEKPETPTVAEKPKEVKMEVEDPLITTEETKENVLPIKEKVIVEEITDSNMDESAPVVELEPVIVEEEKAEEIETKTDTKLTEDMETETEKVVSETDIKNGEAKAPVAEETPPTPTVITEIEEVSDKQLGDVADIIEDLEPIVEEPAAVGDMEDLQNVGEVLEKECDEILSKVQDVTNLDNIPLKPLLNPIAEETMETENIDSNDIVDRILDTELEMEMKQCEDIDVKDVTEMTEETKTEVTENNTEVTNVPETKDVKEETQLNKVDKVVAEAEVESSPAGEKTEDDVQNSDTTKNETPVEVSSVMEKEAGEESKENNIAVDDVKASSENVKPGSDESKATIEDVQAVTKEITPAEEVTPSTEVVKSTKEDDKPEPVDTKAEPETEERPKEINTAQEESNKVTEESKPEKEANKSHVNGESNGEAEKVNGDVSKGDEELSARLAVENGNAVNGSNGDSMDTEEGQGDHKVDSEKTDIKVKTVSTGEPHTDPIEQPTEA